MVGASQTRYFLSGEKIRGISPPLSLDIMGISAIRAGAPICCALPKNRFTAFRLRKLLYVSAILRLAGDAV